MNLRPRKKLWLTAGLTLMALVAANVSSDLARLKYYQPRAPRWDINVHVYQQGEVPAEILFVGSSKVQIGIITSIVSETLRTSGAPLVEAFNVAQPGSGVVENAILLGDVVRSNGCPAVLMLDLSPTALNSNRILWRRLPDYISLRDVPMLAAAVSDLGKLDLLLSSSLRGAARLFDRAVYPPDPRTLKEQRLRGGSQFAAAAPGEPQTRGPSYVMINSFRQHAHRTFWRNFQIEGVALRALNRILTISRRCSSRLILFRMPTLELGKRERNGLDRKFLDFMAGFSARHDVVFIDLNLPAIGIERRHFEVPTHLNAHGAEIVSRYLAKRLAAELATPRPAPTS